MRLPTFVFATILSNLLLHSLTSAHAADFYVAVNGNDAWSGALQRSNRAATDGPFASLERARDALHALNQAGQLTGPSTVFVEGGVYALKQPFLLTTQDSGTATAPIVYRAVPGEKVTLSGGLNVSNFRPYKGDILQADVKSLGLDGLQPRVAGSQEGGVPTFDLYCNDRRMDLARWPNRVAGDPHSGWAYIAAPHAGSRTEFGYFGERPSRWAHPEAAQVHLFVNLWLDEYAGIKSIDQKEHTIALNAPVTYPLAVGNRYCVRNVFEELDAPGEWYFDRGTETLYFWPPTGGGGGATLSVLPGLVSLKDVSYLTLRGFTMEACIGSAVTIGGGAHCSIAGCVIRHAGTGVNINGGTDNGAVGNDIYDLAGMAIRLAGGDRTKLLPSDNYADNNHLYECGQISYYNLPAIAIYGVGNRVAHNLIHDCPDTAIKLLEGNDNLVEYNVIHDVCLETADCAAFYADGRDWTYRGDIVRYNLIHDIQGYGLAGVDAMRGVARYSMPREAQAIYLDEAVCGFRVNGNIIYREGDMGIQLNGGSDTSIQNNVFVDCGLAIGVYNLAGIYKSNPHQMPFQSPPWSTHYPDLARPMQNPDWPENDRFVGNIVATSKPRAGDLESFVVPPVTANIDRNLLWNAGSEAKVGLALLGVGSKGNLSWGQWQAQGFDAHGRNADPLFVDAAHSDFRLRPDSPAYQLGFANIPIEKIGLYKDDLRASWPVEDDARRVSPEPTVYEYPISDGAQASALPLSVPHLSGPIPLDTTSASGAWPGATAANAVILDDTATPGSAAVRHSRAWLGWDDNNLYVALHLEVNPSKPLAAQPKWGSNDAVEIALRDSSKPNAPILIWRGYPDGEFQTTTATGAARAAAGVAYLAHIEDAASWDATWRIPLAFIGIDPARQSQLDCNLTLRKVADDQWVMWRPTGGMSFDLDHAGRIVLVSVAPH